MAIQIECRTCGVLFTPRASGGKPQVRCSTSCRRKSANADYIKRNAPVRTTVCPECGGPVAQAPLGRPRRFCSDECKARVGNRALNRRRQPAPKQTARPCGHCGRSFVPRRRDHVYCDHNCIVKAGQARLALGERRQGGTFDRTCVECGTVFTAKKANAKWCSSICRIRTSRRDESRRRGPAVAGSKPYVDREIFIRDNWVCYLCGEAINADLPRTDAYGATIDHRIPLVIGGTDTEDNVAAAHWHCNRAKGGTVRPEDLAAWIVRRYPEMVAERLAAEQDG